MTSRFTGYPVAEFELDFVSFFGSFVANIVTFILLIIGLFFICNFFEKFLKKYF